MSKNKNKKKRTVGDIIRSIIMFAALAVFLFSAIQLGKIFMEYKKGTDEYNRVREYVTTTEPEKENQEEEPEPETETEEVSKPVPPEVDWVSLKGINEDIIGWLQIEGTKINYPIMKGTDNSYYLKHTFENNSNAAGSIFIDHTNSSDFQDCNTLIYGHNMRNGSMFGMLRKYFKDQNSLPGRYIWICTPEKNYRYEIFSSHVVDAVGETYTLFPEADEQFASYVERMKQQSLVNFGTEVTKDDKVITLSTCTGNDSTRFVVQAKREGEY